MTKVSMAWDRVERILTEKHSSISLNPGASTSDTVKIAPSGFEAPSELVEMYERHDMGNPMFFFMELPFLSAKGVQGFLDLYEVNLESAPESFFDNPSDGIFSEDFYSRKAVLIPITNGARSNLCVESRGDTTQKEHGRVIWMDIETENLIFVSASISEYIDRCAEDLESGIYRSDEDGLHIDHCYEVSTVEYCVKRWSSEN